MYRYVVKKKHAATSQPVLPLTDYKECGKKAHNGTQQQHARANRQFGVERTEERTKLSGISPDRFA
jgi:hypothetical protein